MLRMNGDMKSHDHADSEHDIYLSKRLRRQQDNHMTAKSRLCLFCCLRASCNFLYGKQLPQYNVKRENLEYHHNCLRLQSHNLINCSQEVASLDYLVFILIT